ncbi:MAG TPA: mechanosensitive ion channel domain-containing protein [Acetobacteraceae bacterium]|nr:mechanosensitive ion channel domain-containing protein [Acetobacteraceae bacterium]
MRDTVNRGKCMVNWRTTLRALIRLVLFATTAVALMAGQGAVGQTRISVPLPSVRTAQASAVSGDQASVQPDRADLHAKEIVKDVNEALGRDLNATIASWRSDLHHVETGLSHPRPKWSQLDTYRDELQRLRSQTGDLSGRLQSQLNSIKAQLSLLGPAPAAGQPQPEQIALSRARLNYRLGLLAAGEASIRTANLRIDNLLDKIEDIRRAEFTSYLLKPIPGIYTYQTWSKVPDAIPETSRQVRNLVTDWWRSAQDRSAVARVGFEAALLSFLLCFAGWRGVRRLREWHGAGEVSFWRRASSAAGVVLFRVLPVAVPVMFAYFMIAAEQPFPYRLSWLFYLAAESIVIVFTVGALVTTVFSPWAPRWRLVSVPDAVALRICCLVTLLALVYGAATLLYAVTLLVRAPFALTIAVALPSSLFLVGLVVAILQTPLGQDNSPESSILLLLAVRSLAWIIVSAIVVCSLSGYLALARFLAQQLVVSGLILAVVYLLLVWVDGFAQCISDDSAVLGRWLREHGKLELGRREQLALPVRLLMKLAVLIFAVPFIMLQWGYTWPDIESWYGQLFFGFHIGNTQVTLGALLASVIVFAVGYAAARLFQGWLDIQVLQPAGIPGGLRHSIRTGVGYVGILIAALAAFSYAGFSLSSLAIVAGAFSIGIGFGLQNVVNNFVSGIIMLVERPVRVGDLVVVGGEEGYVRRISVRSTELETFDHANVLIPNSAFISEKVKNWTLRNHIGRIAISVGTAYDSDLSAVKNVLLRVAGENPEVLGSPEPIVELTEFGGSSVNFSLYVFVEIYDIAKTMRIRTDISIAIFNALAEAGIGIPFTQADIRIRNIDQVREAIVGYTWQHQERSSKNGKDGQRGMSEMG